jgi:small subunit ribosomal protein S3Ae
MAVKKRRKTADSWRKKEWYTIYAPKMFDQIPIATTPSDDPKKLNDRVLKTPLREITGSISHQFTKLWFRVVDVKGKSAYTEVDGFELTREFLRRNVRRRRSMIRAVEEATTKDKKKLQISLYTFTARKVDTSKKNEIRKLMIEFLKTRVGEENFDSIIEKMIFGTLATELFRETKKLAWIKRVEIAKCEVLRPSK